MKNLKLFIATFTIIFAVFVSTANEISKKSQTLFETEFVIPNCEKTTLELEKTICTTGVSPIVSDIEMREDYNNLHEEEDAIFEFDSTTYLPEDFNAYDENESILSAHELLNAEADAPFNFNTSDYLPEDFYTSI